MGLVDYPATLAPASGSVTVATQCADNAHRTSSSLNAICSSTGTWSGSPQCACNDGYRSVTVNGRQMCVYSDFSSSPAAPPSMLSIGCMSTYHCVTLSTDPVHVDDIEVLGCGSMSWSPPRGNEGEPLGYAVRFFDGATYETSFSGYRTILRMFEDIGKQWATAENLPTDGRTVYASVSVYQHVSE